MMDWNATFEWIGRVAVVFVFVGGLVVWFGKTYIDKWLTKRFQGQLDAIKHAQALEVAKNKLSFDAKLHRATKLHEREFEILPRSWEMLGAAGGAIRLLISNNQIHTDVSKLEPLSLAEFLGPLPFSDAEKQAIMNAPRAERTDLFIERKLRFQMVDASTLAQDFHNYVAINGVFIEPTLRKKLITVSGVFDSLVGTHSMLVIHDGPPKIDVGTLNRHKLESLGKLVDEIGDEISERIWGASKLDA